MDKDTRNAIERATQKARKLLEEDFAAQLEGDFDVHRDGTVATKAGGHLSSRDAYRRERIVAAIEHKRAVGMIAADAVRDYLRDAAFTTLNRFVALKMLETRGLVLECITKGEQSVGYGEFCGLARGLPLLPDSAGYRLYVESLFDELSTEVKVLFDRRDPSSVLWPKRATFEQLLAILNEVDLAHVWGEDETIGWVYQFFNGQDERKKMREESQVPRNSRELAVRNQFFTPRYVVQFLTDNTLGLIWYEMRGTKTVLADRCAYMVRKPGDDFAPRVKKDPRDLRVLDPACGSGHFLLYAFDLLLAIYEEAHADPDSPKSEATGKTLAEDYPSVAALRRAVPALVLAHNLHGVDIDPRCAQIAQLALWLRAQTAYRDFGIGRAERAHIRRSNIVVAEPLVADEQIAREFVAKLGDVELGRVFTSLVDSLNLAGDLGLLLRVEKLVKAARKQGDLFAPPEVRIRAALDRFVRDEAGATSTRRRLFADDAAHGVALLGIAEKKFDVVLMNPPFGNGSARAKAEFDKQYPHSKNDIYAAFVERGIELLHQTGVLGAITSRAGFFLSSLRRWREFVITNAPPVVFADLGHGVMDSAMVEAAAYCLQRGRSQHDEASFLRVLEETEKALPLQKLAADSSKAFKVRPSTFCGLPGQVFCYWLPPSVLDTFSNYPELNTFASAWVGLQTNEDFRWLRCWWESSMREDERSPHLVPFAKGGAYSMFYADIYLGVRWGAEGRWIKEWKVDQLRQGHITANNSRCWNESHYFEPGITWPSRTQRFGPRVLPRGCIFAHKGPALVAREDQEHTGEPSESLLLALLAVMSSQVFSTLVATRLNAADATARSFETGIIGATPVPPLSERIMHALTLSARRAWSLKRLLDTANETSHAFVLPPGLNERITGLDRDANDRAARLIQKQIDEMAFDLYGIGPEDRAAIEASGFTDNAAGEEEAEVGDEGSEDSGDLVPDSWHLISWLLGVAFGRFDPRLQLGERAIPPDPEPFDALPSRSPGMYPEGEEPADHPDILVDDEGHADDLTARALAIAERVKIETLENLRGWFAKEFFPLHIKMYSKSRRKAPIYWQLATPSASYSVWLYIHAFSKDTLFRVQNDYAAPRLAHEERRLESLSGELRDGTTAAQRKQLAMQESLVEELRAFLDEVKRVAPLWNPNLDDGVIINFAPLWRLVPQHKSWQKELRATWDALCEGKYDWAHLAMHLWPERVVPRCAKDRSIAIAHGLEDVFWAEGTDGKWIARKTPTKSVEQLVKERTSAAVKSALKSLLDAPVAAGKTTRRGSGRRKAAAVLGEDA